MPPLSIDTLSSPAELTRRLIAFDTTNPPGNEAACIAYLAGLLRSAGIEPTLVERTPGRPNLVARLPGAGQAPALALFGHVDVVGTQGQTWIHPPFAGELAEGMIWGRGALDMKGGIAMLVSAFLRLAAAGQPPAGDLVLACFSDEEADGDDGAGFVVERHAELLAGVHYALGEGGGFSFSLQGRRFYPIMVAEKQFCQLRGVLHGPAGHASMPQKDGTVGRLAAVLYALQRRLPVHVTPPARQMLETVAGHLPWPAGMALRGLLRPALTDRLLNLMGSAGHVLDPLLHHTVSATIVHAGEKVNVLPAEATLVMDGRLLPGYRPEALLDELRPRLGQDVELWVERFDPGPQQPDLALYPMLAGVLKEADPSGEPLPFLLSGVTDGRYLARLGIQTYGYLPMQLAPGLERTIHAADERVPAETLEFGTRTLCQAIVRYGLLPR